jgi:hypothetical protein
MFAVKVARLNAQTTRAIVLYLAPSPVWTYLSSEIGGARFYGVKRWPNVHAESERLLSPRYIFCRFDVKKRLPILKTTGVISVLGFGKEPAPVPDVDTEALRAVLRCLYTIYGYKGKKVRDQILSVLETVDVPRCMGFTMSYSYSDQNRIKNYICYISDLTKVRARRWA